MIEHKVPIQSLIDHIKTAIDVDPWAKEMAEELLKEQEAKAKWVYCEDEYGQDGYECSECGFFVSKDALAMLIEQEAVRPERQHSGGGTTWWNVCGNCRTAINPNDKFCHECGKAVKWE